MYNLMDLSNKRILITGASSGIGRETAILLSKLGAQITMVARNKDKLEAVLLNLEGKKHEFHCYDLKNVEGIEILIKQLILKSGPFDGFVHAAGITNTRPLKMMKPKFLKEVMEINFNSFVEIVRCITSKHYFNTKMSIVAISSIASVQGNQSKTAYCASKAAIDSAIRCMAKELAPKSIRVNSVMPGLIKTDIYESFLEKSVDSEDAKNIISRQYLGVGEPIDVANMIAFLLTDLSKFITGSSIPIDGGRLSS